MTEYQSMFINYAATLRSESFNVTFAPCVKNGKPFLLLKVELGYSWNSPAQKWANGYYDYSSQTQFPPVWTGTSSPWINMSFSGEISSEVKQTPALSGTPKFCGNCGQALKAGSKFCSGCGAALASVTTTGKAYEGQFAIEFTDLSVDELLGGELGAALAESVVSLIFVEHTPQERSLLLAFLSEEFATAKVNVLINGTKTTSKSPINLAEVQKLQAAVQLGNPLTTIQSKYAELILRSAPLSFGYWGAIKSILKAQPDKVSREAIGAGFARISALGQPQNNWWGNRDNIEDLRILADLVIVPLAPTRYYLSRLGRRKLVDSASIKPADYLDLATGFLIAADRSSSTIDYMFAQIIYGAHSYLSPGSRSVRRELSKNEVAPFEPQLWRKASEHLSKIWTGVSHSHEIQDFAFTLATSHKISLPLLEGRALNLALGSSIAELRAQAIRQIVADAKYWFELNEAGWLTFLREVEVAELGKLVTSLTHLDSHYELLGAVKKMFEEIEDPRNERFHHLAALYFSLEPEYQFWGHDAELEGKIAATLILSGLSVDVENFDLLNNRLGFNALLACWSYMLDQQVFDENQRRVFNDAALAYWSAQEPYKRKYAIQKLASLAPSLYSQLGTELIANTYDFELVQAFIKNLADFSENLSSITAAVVDLLSVVPFSDVSRTLEAILESEVIADSVSLVEVLNASPTARQLAWTEIATEPNTSLAQALESHKQLLSSTLLELNQSNVSLAMGHQVGILVNFFGSSKIQSSIPDALLIGATTNPVEELAILGQKILKKRGSFSDHWLQIAETQMPLAIGFAREFLQSLNKEELSPSLLLALDSPVIAVRDMALELLDTLRDKIDIPFIYSRLAESRDPVIRGRVAEEALLAPWSDGKDLVAFDSEMLVTLRRTRNAREHVMARFEEESSQSSESSFVTPERLQALISLTRIGDSRDKEWALARLAQLKNAGLDIEGVSLTFVTGGQTHV